MRSTRSPIHISVRLFDTVATDLLELASTGLHPDRQRRLVARFGSASAAVEAIRAGRVDVSPAALDASRVPGEQRLARLVAAGIEFIPAGDDRYPVRLAQREDAPLALFVRGSVPSGSAVAVVGTRRCTTYGRRVARRYGEAIAGAGWALISGLARGIDGAAHDGTVAAGGRGVAVLGSGIDVMYPPEHGGLADMLVELGGAIVSEYPPGTPPEPWRFPPRNRIISGLADAVVVVEAAVTGGALITAGAALGHGVPVFAVPGDIERPTSEGCNRLIRDGAQPVLDPDDLIEELGLALGA